MVEEWHQREEKAYVYLHKYVFIKYIMFKTTLTVHSLNDSLAPKQNRQGNYTSICIMETPDSRNTCLSSLPQCPHEGNGGAACKTNKLVCNLAQKMRYVSKTQGVILKMKDRKKKHESSKLVPNNLNC